MLHGGQRQHRLVNQVQSLPDPAHMRGGIGGGIDAAVLALEERDLEEIFEQSDLVADRRRGHAKFVGSLGDRGIAGHGLESPDRIQWDAFTHVQTLSLSPP